MLKIDLLNSFVYSIQLHLYQSTLYQNIFLKNQHSVTNFIYDFLQSLSSMNI